MYSFSNRMNEVSARAVREILKLTADPNVIAFSAGSPANEAFPIETIQEIMNEAMEKNGTKVLQYGITEGLDTLREAYLNHLAVPKGLNVSIDNIMTTTGATQGIHLACDVFLDPGDVVLVESPSFLSTLMLFKKYFVKCIPLEMDEDGIMIEDLEEKIRLHQPKMLYTIPTFQNPTGKTLPEERRKKIAELASENNVIVLEDDPYGELRYRGDEISPIKKFDQSGHVILINSFSKIISPGLRVGAIVADEKILGKMTVSKQFADTHTTTLAQYVCAEFLNRNLLPEHLISIRQLYKERMETMLNGMDIYFPKGTNYTKPDGGLFIWAELPGECNTQELLKKAVADYQVAFVPGAPYYINPQDGRSFMRLNFSANTPEKIQEGMKRLSDLFYENHKFLEV